MSEEEIQSRILICEIKERDYREVGNTKTADRYHNEVSKWNDLLYKLNPKRDKELEDYKKGYNRLEDKIDKAIDYIKKQSGKGYNFGSQLDSWELIELLKILEVKDERD